jgi:outer membrane protein OmpA-like peptidoglycan-associated protein
VASAHLDQVAEFLLARRNVQLRIEGHTDTRGSAKANAKLSRKRAAAVKSYLVDLGVPADRLITAAYGELAPVTSNASAKGRQKNRRSQFTIIED